MPGDGFGGFMRAVGLSLWTLVAVSCGTAKETTVIACAADGTCPSGSHCLAGVCQPGDTQDAASTDASSDTSALCLPDLSGGPSPRGESFGGFADGKLWTLSGDDGIAVSCNPNPTPVADGWTFTPCLGWSSVDPASAPSPRARAGATSDGNNSVWVFGGRWRDSGTGNYTLRNDTWQWTKAGGWAQVDDGTTGGPKGRSSTVLGVDITTGFLWLHGGNASNNGLAFAPLGDVWFLDPNFGGWQIFKTSGAAPVARIMHAGTVTRDGKYLVIFGGGDANAFQGPFFSDTWRLDLKTGTWTQIATTGTKPAARILASMVAIGGSSVLLFGGHDDGDVDNRNDVWQLEAEAGTWTVLRKGDLGANGSPDAINKPANATCDFPADFMQIDQDSPERRESALFSWDDVGQKAWLFGGKSDCGTLRDVWTFAPATATWQVIDDTPKGWSCLRYISPCTHLCGG